MHPYIEPMARILINDGIHPSGKKKLINAGHTVDDDKIMQDELMNRLNAYDAICVRSATKVREELIKACPNLKVIGRGGVGLDNIDVKFARENGISVVNTPAASSRSVAELAIAHLMSVARFLYKSNRNMPVDGDSEFSTLKKSFAKGFEVKGKKLGIIGFGRIGQETAKLALSMGMDVMPVDPILSSAKLDIHIAGQTISVDQKTYSFEDMLQNADIITLHIPFTGNAILGEREFALMKKGTVLINASRGGTVDESAMLTALDNGTLAAAGLDVFENEPTPRKEVISHPKISLTPHIGASTAEAQENIGLELADQLIDLLKV